MSMLRYSVLNCHFQELALAIGTHCNRAIYGARVFAAVDEFAPHYLLLVLRTGINPGPAEIYDYRQDSAIKRTRRSARYNCLVIAKRVEEILVICISGSHVSIPIKAFKNRSFQI
jgi:hypothetical protein